MNEAERLAKELEEDFHLSYPSESMWKAAAELSRLSAINAELVEAAENVLRNKRGEDDWLILAIDCVVLEKALEKAKQ